LLSSKLYLEYEKRLLCGEGSLSSDSEVDSYYQFLNELQQQDIKSKDLKILKEEFENELDQKMQMYINTSDLKSYGSLQSGAYYHFKIGMQPDVYSRMIKCKNHFDYEFGEVMINMSPENFKIIIGRSAKKEGERSIRY